MMETEMQRVRRRFFAEEIEAVCRLGSARLVDAFAVVPREQFLRPGPWTVVGASDFAGAAMGVGVQTRLTPDDDPARVYHNIAIAIDPSRQLFNGQPGTLAVFIDALALAPGARVMHVGCGLGYYAAVMAHCVGPTGRVVGFEVDETLAAEARRNLAPMPWIEARHGDASEPLDGSFDAILVNAGVTHPLDTWLDALAPGGRMVLPLTATMPAMGATIGKGLVIVLTRRNDGAFDARPVAFVAIYSAIGIRDESLNVEIGKALMRSPWPALTRMRRDEHDVSAACWLHATRFCLSVAKD